MCSPVVAKRSNVNTLAEHAHIVVIELQPAGGILPATGETGTDVIAMVTHGRSGLAQMLIGSVADKVVRAAETPVLVYRPKAPRA